MSGYSASFISGVHLQLPALTDEQEVLRAPLKSKPNQFELKYTHFSVVMNKERKFAFYAATNIDGKKWDAIVKERTKFIKDENMENEFQTGDELYDFYKSKTNNDFDKGHISKFQDPQWGSTDDIIKKAADDTMKFTNCLPQHHSLNRGAWKSLEDYIIKKFTVQDGKDGRKVSVFAGPVLLDNDPFYIDKINGEPFQIPCHFWKVIVYRNIENKLSAVAFLMSQKNILKKHNFIVDKKKDVRAVAAVKAAVPVDFFKDFKKGEPYQVRIDFIEKATGLKFGLGQVFQPYTKKESTEIIYKRVEVPVSRAAFTSMSFKDRPLNFDFKKIAL